MKVVSESEWEAMRSELAKDPDPRGQQMLDFILNWAVLAEHQLALHDDSGDHLVTLPIVALRNTLDKAELTTGTIIPIMQVGQALLILGSVWEPAASDRERFASSMNPLERKLFSELAQVWIAERQRQAAGPEMTLDDVKSYYNNRR